MADLEYDYSEDSMWEQGNYDEQESSVNRKSLDYGRSLAGGPIPDILSQPHPYPPIHAQPPPPIPILDSKHSEPHQFVHVEDWDKFKAGHGRGNPYHHLNDIQERDGVHHKEAVSKMFI